MDRLLRVFVILMTSLFVLSMLASVAYTTVELYRVYGPVPAMTSTSVGFALLAGIGFVIINYREGGK